MAHVNTKGKGMMRYRNQQGVTLGPIGFLIATNIILYITTSVRPDFFINLFGLSPSTFVSQPWTIITSMFIHAPFPGIAHILGNMFTLYFFGSYVIQLVGERKFWFIYFAGGILGGILYLLLAPLFSVAIGASGAIFAIAGALTVLIPRERVIIFPLPVPIPLWGAVIGGFLLLSFMPGVAWQAHLGGLLLGLIAGYFFRRRERISQSSSHWWRGRQI